MRHILTLILFCLLLAGCGPKNTFVLMPDKDGNVGEITITNIQGSRTLNQAGQSTTVASNISRPADTQTMDEATIQAIFGKAIEIQPSPPTKFLLYFNFDSIQLRQESRNKLPEIVQITQDKASKDVSVIGHTDRSGNQKYNFSLSMRRARHIQKELRKLGVVPGIITTTSHGEGNPLIPTQDNTREPRNRRVEVIVR